ncbi:MAG: hypothetical protein JRN01_05070 [Nitrososphaerota archaeon]|jgi:hypothetical protein|nr:hypothetical protein [Nitrososphaerota archaeon]
MNTKILVLIIALFGMIVPVSPMMYASVSPAHAATTAQVVIGGMSTSYPYGFTAAKYNVSGYSGQYTLAKLDGSTPTSTDYLDINLSQIAAAGWPAGEFNLTASTNGYLVGSPVGTVFAAGIPVSQVKLTVHSDHGPLSGFYNYTYNGQTFYLGNNSVIAPIAYNVPGGSYYIKAVFGSSNIFASYAQEIVLPGIKVSGIVDTNEGPAGSAITVKGTGFSASGLVNLTWTYTVNSKSIKQFETLTASSLGTFTATVTSPELKIETPTGSSSSTGSVTFQANDTHTATMSNSASWVELPRVLGVNEYSPVINSWISTTPTLNLYNGSTFSSSFYEKESMVIEGNYFVPSSTVTLTFGTMTLGTVKTNSTGFFNTTVTVPVAAAGTYAVNATDPLAYIYFKSSTVPEVMVTPTSATSGSSISINGYAFNKNSVANVTWVYAKGVSSVGIESIANLTTNSLGEFSTTFMIPLKTLGGTSVVNASTNDANPTAYATFDIVPTLMLSSSTASLGSSVKANAYGLDSGSASAMIVKSYPYIPSNLVSVTLGHTPEDYGFAYDNVMVYMPVSATTTDGELSATLQATGYPMLHYVQLVNASTIPSTLVASQALNVTGTTNTEAQTTAALNSLNKTVSSLPAQITSSLSSFETSISSELSTISSGVSSIQSTLSSMSSTLSSVSSAVSSIQSTLSSISSSISSISTSASQISSVSSQVSSLMTYIIVVAVLAVIIIIIQIVMLVRKK